jgi:hypothetical protein
LEELEKRLKVVEDIDRVKFVYSVFSMSENYTLFSRLDLFLA